jgi:UDP-glucose 4-epimerase
MKALVCGGAGYIGSHMVRALHRGGHDVLVVDNLSTGHRDAIDGAGLAEIDLLDQVSLMQVMTSFKPDIVFHFAALSVVRDSLLEPLTYYRNNVSGTVVLLDCMRQLDIDRLVFSSSAAVYGATSPDLIDESTPLSPINPYGVTKMIVERLLEESFRAHGIRSVSLRYFNAAGADPEGGIGESHEPETHLIPNALSAAAGSTRLQVFGSDYATPDGTCIRDYIHVNDLAKAHLAAAEYLESHEGAYRFNLGTGQGCSVLQIIDAVRRITERELTFELLPRRPGDPACLVASHALATSELGWSPKMSGVDCLVKSAWSWHLNRKY